QASAFGGHRRGVSATDMSKEKGALLFINGSQTSCEVGLLSDSAGLVSADCLDFNTNTVTLNTLSQYEIYVDEGNGTRTPSIYSLSLHDISVHPSYNATSLEYNIAVVEFNKGANSTYTPLLVWGSYEVGNSAYVRRTFDDATKQWNTPVVVQMPGDEKDCGDWSGVYRENNWILLCTNIIQQSMYNSSCAMPFGSLYTTIGGRVGLVGLYSHSVIMGEDICLSSYRWLSYYTYMRQVVSFAAHVLGQPISIFNGTNITVSQTSGVDLYVSNTPAAVDLTGKVQIGGDIYAARDEHAEAAPSDSEPASNKAGTGLSRGQVTAIAVAVPVVVISAVAVLASLYYRRQKKHKDDDDWDPHAERMNIRELANEIRGIDDPTQPPTYNEVMQRPTELFSSDPACKK
ncbi:hypothetical protein IWW50_002263, partial [Coemansia erecta]